MMDQLETISQGLRRARTKQFIQLGALVGKAGLLETFGITVGSDLQKDPETQRPISALFKGLLELNEMANSEDVHMQFYAEQGLAELRKLKRENSKTPES
jgi:hypothetical protein